MVKRAKKSKTVYTIGHSNRTIDQFLELLEAHGIEKIVDIRTVPRSRHNPQFNGDDLSRSLKESEIGYERLESLGGFRHARKDSKNLGWRNAAFRGFADYMETEDFAEGLERLKKTAEEKTTAIMCAEAVPWRCHRSLIADALTVQGWTVLHISSKKTARIHELTPFLKVRKGKLLYPGYFLK